MHIGINEPDFLWIWALSDCYLARCELWWLFNMICNMFLFPMHLYCTFKLWQQKLCMDINNASMKTVSISRWVLVLHRCMSLKAEL